MRILVGVVVVIWRWVVEVCSKDGMLLGVV